MRFSFPRYVLFDSSRESMMDESSRWTDRNDFQIRARRISEDISFSFTVCLKIIISSFLFLK